MEIRICEIYDFKIGNEAASWICVSVCQVILLSVQCAEFESFSTALLIVVAVEVKKYWDVFEKRN